VQVLAAVHAARVVAEGVAVVKPPCTSSIKHGARPKRRFPTREIAWLEVARMILVARVKPPGRGSKRYWNEPYKCPDCSGWHLTTATHERKAFARTQVARIHAGQRPLA
jgi:hypothetical protein